MQNTVNIIDARKRLGFDEKASLTLQSVRTHFRIAVRRGHSDHGGQSDICAIVLARDQLMAFLKERGPDVNSNACLECENARGRCMYHRTYGPK